MKLLTIALALAIGCMRPATIPPPQNVRTIAVLPPNNRTGDELLVAGGSLLERTLHSTRVTVPDVLADETEQVLRERGYDVVSRSAPAATALYLEIRRWEPDSDTHPTFVIVGVSATLIDTATGREVWSVRPSVHPVATPGTVILGSAYEAAARKVVAEILAGW